MLHIVLVLYLVLLATYVPVVLKIMVIGRCLHPVSASISHGYKIIANTDTCTSISIGASL